MFNFYLQLKYIILQQPAAAAAAAAAAAEIVQASNVAAGGVPNALADNKDGTKLPKKGDQDVSKTVSELFLVSPVVYYY